MEERTIRLNLTEIFAAWTAVCGGSPFFARKIYTQRLKSKLFEAMTDEERRELRDKHEMPSKINGKKLCKVVGCDKLAAYRANWSRKDGARVQLGYCEMHLPSRRA